MAGERDRAAEERVVSAASGVVGRIGAAGAFVFMSVGVLVFGAGVILLWVDPQDLQVSDPVPLSTKLFFAGLPLAGAWLMWWMGIPIREVAITPEGLRISGLRRSELVPFADIDDVDQVTWGHPRMVTIRFSRPTAFGRVVRFRPIPWRVFGPPWPAGEDADVVEIRDRSLRARPLEPLSRT